MRHSEVPNALPNRNNLRVCETPSATAKDQPQKSVRPGDACSGGHKEVRNHCATCSRRTVAPEPDSHPRRVSKTRTRLGSSGDPHRTDRLQNPRFRSPSARIVPCKINLTTQLPVSSLASSANTPSEITCFSNWCFQDSLMGQEMLVGPSRRF